MKMVEFANSADPDELAHDEQPHLDLYCLLLAFELSIAWAKNNEK